MQVFRKKRLTQQRKNEWGAVMSESSTTKKHSAVLVIISIACLGAIAESITQRWEFWVPPMIAFGMISAWIIHIRQLHHETYRENYYLIFSLLVAIYHGVHQTSFFDVIAVSLLYLTVTALLKRLDFLRIGVAEFFGLMVMHIIWAYRTHTIVFDSLNISRIALHMAVVICVYRVLLDNITEAKQAQEEIKKRDDLKQSDQMAMEDFLVNISHELRTPVNVINGICTIILKNENRNDVLSISDAGRKMMRQIENIQDYSEIQRGSVTLETETYPISSLWEEVVSDYNSVSGNDKPELIIDMDPNLPTVLEGDVKKLKKIIRHLMENAYKFTKSGGVYYKISGIKREYGINLILEVTDTGCGMTAIDIENISKGMYQANRKRDRSTGGIGLGLPVVYGFVRSMDGFVTIDSEKGHGTTVRVSVVQNVVDASPCLSLIDDKEQKVAVYQLPGKYRIGRMHEFFTNMATNLAKGLGVRMFHVSSLQELKGAVKEEEIGHVFMGEKEYYTSPSFFDEMANWGVTVVVSSTETFHPSENSKVLAMPKPLCGFPIVNILNGIKDVSTNEKDRDKNSLDLHGLRGLVVDDEPMNLVVATGFLKEYGMEVESATSGDEAIRKYTIADYDIVFMDYMMPQMDGIEALKQLRHLEKQKKKKLVAVALSADAVSGAKDMFLSNGFDGYIPKPLQTEDFERVMHRLIVKESTLNREGK